MIKTICFSSLVLMPLGIEVYLLDKGEFWIHVTNLQVSLDIRPWFSNGGSFACSDREFSAQFELVNRIY